MTYGYDSGLLFSRTKAGIDNFARDLLNRLRMMRATPVVRLHLWFGWGQNLTVFQARYRPLIFIARSLGGIVIKKVCTSGFWNLRQEVNRALQLLIIAREVEAYYGAILKSTVGIIFMGTPHRGSDIASASWAVLLTNIVNAAFLGQAVRKDLLRELQAKSTTLTDISRQFVQRSTPLRIMSFIELQVELPLRELVNMTHPNTQSALISSELRL